MMWFASGIVMMYSGGMPVVTGQDRLASLPALDLSRVHVAPADAQRLAGHAAGDVQLTSVMGRPAYRIGEGVVTTVFADDGRLLEPVDAEQARDIAARFVGLPPQRLQYLRTLEEPDQWTLGRDQQMPLHVFRADDESGTELYVSADTAEVVQRTTGRSRALAWAGAIPHWLYFSALRSDPPLWARVVIWTSGIACALAVLGLVLAFTQFRRVRPFSLSTAIPYRGWMRWHYMLGAVFGVFAITWTFSGLLSMEPFAWTRATGLMAASDVMSGGDVELDRFGMPEANTFHELPAGGLRQIGFERIQDRPYYELIGSDAAATVLIDATTRRPRHEPFSTDSLVQRLRSEWPDVPLIEQTMLEEYDAYYYARNARLPLPVLRLKFGDADRSWFYVDPRRGEIVAQVHRWSRLERWLYRGLHNLDFSFWYSNRPWWDIGTIALLLGGFAVSTLGFVLGIKRLRNDLRYRRS